MSHPKNSEPDHARVRVPPPALLLGCLVAGWCVDWSRSWPIVPETGSALLRGLFSGVLILSGLGLAGYCASQFKRAQTRLEPWRATTRIITDGPYRYSRNPIYVAFAIAGAGIALAFNTYWMLLGVVAFVLLANRLVIEREEAYLERKFGDLYSNYRRETRRWI